MGLTEIFISIIAFLGTAVVALFRLWRGAKAKQKAADLRAKTQERMRGYEREASQLDDTSLADRLTHPND